jgi:hypothetical protein
VRQLLGDKVSGHSVGVWLLVAEHLRLGTWDLLRSWTGQPTERIEPRLAMQLVHEAALCTTGIRRQRALVPRGGFELANGLPFLASDTAVHELLASHTVNDAIRLQLALGKLRRAGRDFQGKVLAIDPHRVPSHSRRQMRLHCKNSAQKPIKMAQTFWLLDADTEQPICFTTATASRSVAQATPGLLDLAAAILGPAAQPALVLADAEHYCAELLDHVGQRPEFEMLVPMQITRHVRQQMASIPRADFIPRWVGLATATQPYTMKRSRCDHPYYQYVQRTGERPDDWYFKPFLSTAACDAVELLTQEFPKRWHVEEFFNANQALGWQRAGTMNLNVRYGQMTLALIAQAVIHQLRVRVGDPVNRYDAKHLAKDLFLGLDGDVRVSQDTIIVTYYNAPNADRLRAHYERLPEKLAQAHISPQIPWLYGFHLDFRFR